MASPAQRLAPEALQRWVRERQLASDQRAGSWARAQALRRRGEFVRRAWPAVLGIPLISVCLAPLVLLVPHWARQFALGVILSSGVWASVLFVTVMSGTVPQYAGGLAEQFTATELRALRRRQWHLANGVMLKKGDIDHVVVGPGGVLVVESKYSSSGWVGGRFSDDQVKRAVRQALATCP